MVRSFFTRCLSSLIVISFCTVCYSSQWYVSIWGNNSYNGSPTNPWRDIQYAINNSNVVNGDIIYIGTGTYIENLTFTKILTIRGAAYGVDAFSRNSTGSLDPNLETIVNGKLNAITGVTIDGIAFDVLNTSYNGNTNNLSNFALTNCIFIDGPVAPGTGAQAIIKGYGDNISITHNAFFGGPGINHDNLWLWCTGGALTNLSISNNYFIQGYNGIIQEGDPQTLTLSNNYFDSCYYGATCGNLNNPSIYNNTFNNCFVQGLLIGTHNGVLHDNYFQNTHGVVSGSINYGFGLGLFGGQNSTYPCDNLQVYLNEISNNKQGIYIRSGVGGSTGQETNFYNNSVSGDSIGIWIHQDGSISTLQGLIITNNTISGNTGTGRYGVYNELSTVINAVNNWWGNSSGPYDPVNNPSGTGDKVSANVNYTPWTGAVQSQSLTNANLNNPITFSGANTTITFSTLPGGTNVTLTAARLGSPPPGVPNITNYINTTIIPGFYLNITAPGLTDYSFEATIVVNVTNVPGFNSSTKYMFWSPIGNKWIAQSGYYDPVGNTYTFKVNHLSVFAFVNSTTYDGIYITRNIASPQSSQVWYPHHGMDGSTSGGSDWSYVNDTATWFVAASGTQGFSNSTFDIVWDKSRGNLTITEGNLFSSSGHAYTHSFTDLSSGNTGRMEINFATSDNGNVYPDTSSGRYLVSLKFTFTGTGYIPLSLAGIDFSYYSGPSNIEFLTTAASATMLFYLGDFMKDSPPNYSAGDGKITFLDVNIFSLAYWSVPGPGSLYKAKFDIGPVNPTNNYWGLPLSDGSIDFEDLVVFSIGYGEYASGELPQIVNGNTPVIFSTNKIILGNDGFLRVPVKVSGNVNDLRAFSLVLNYSSDNLDYAGVEKQGKMNSGTTFLMGKSENGKITVDGARICNDAINEEGVIANVLFTAKSNQAHTVNLESVKARNSRNIPLTVKIESDGYADVPRSFGLLQNYPNPFNPKTIINYQLPKSEQVKLVVYDILGKEVSTLVNEKQNAGYYQVEWDGTNYASGIYFYKVSAGEFSSVKKMILLK